jgi:hypothetical protein
MQRSKATCQRRFKRFAIFGSIVKNPQRVGYSHAPFCLFRSIRTSVHAFSREVCPQDRFNYYYRKKLALFSHLFEETGAVFHVETSPTAHGAART